MEESAATRRQLTQLLDDLVSLGLEPWWGLAGAGLALAEYELPRKGDQTATATRRRVKLLRGIVERAERSGLG